MPSPPSILEALFGLQVAFRIRTGGASAPSSGASGSPAGVEEGLARGRDEGGAPEGPPPREAEKSEGVVVRIGSAARRSAEEAAGLQLLPAPAAATELGAMQEARLRTVVIQAALYRPNARLAQAADPQVGENIDTYA